MVFLNETCKCSQLFGVHNKKKLKCETPYVWDFSSVLFSLNVSFSSLTLLLEQVKQKVYDHIVTCVPGYDYTLFAKSDQNSSLKLQKCEIFLL